MSNASYAFSKANFAGRQARREDKVLGLWGLNSGNRSDARQRVHKLDRCEGKLTLTTELINLANAQVETLCDEQAMPDLNKGRAYSTDDFDHLASNFDVDFDFEELELQALTLQLAEAEQDAYARADRDLMDVMGCGVPADFGWDAMAQLSLEADTRSKRNKKAFQAHRDDDGEDNDF